MNCEGPCLKHCSNNNIIIFIIGILLGIKIHSLTKKPIS